MILQEMESNGEPNTAGKSIGIELPSRHEPRPSVRNIHAMRNDHTMRNCHAMRGNAMLCEISMLMRPTNPQSHCGKLIMYRCKVILVVEVPPRKEVGEFNLYNSSRSTW